MAGGTDENLEKPQSGRQVSHPSFEESISQIQVYRMLLPD
jgi:hypothetical protein